MLTGPYRSFLRHVPARIAAVDALAPIAGVALISETNDAVAVVGLEEGQVRADALEAFFGTRDKSTESLRNFSSSARQTLQPSRCSRITVRSSTRAAPVTTSSR